MSEFRAIAQEVCSNIESKATLNDGNSIPYFGLGVYQARNGGETENAVYDALIAGYRHVDTAEIYRNEEDVGRGVRKFLEETGLSRKDIWVTTKFFPSQGRGKGAVKDALTASLARLQLDYVDLYLIHAPMDKQLRLEQWQAFEELKDEGLTKSIGVSNYGIHHIQELLAISKYKPSINQVDQKHLFKHLFLNQLCCFVQKLKSILTLQEKIWLTIAHRRESWLKRILH